jgi:hypothetical protein
MRLLLVEDDEMIAETVLESMRREGYAIDWAQDGRAAECGASGFFGHRFGVKRVFQTGVVDGEES